MMEHPSKDINEALINLSDALVSWERETGIESVLILREVGGFLCRLDCGKPTVPDDIPDELLLARFQRG